MIGISTSKPNGINLVVSIRLADPNEHAVSPKAIEAPPCKYPNDCTGDRRSR